MGCCHQLAPASNEPACPRRRPGRKVEAGHPDHCSRRFYLLAFPPGSSILTNSRRPSFAQCAAPDRLWYPLRTVQAARRVSRRRQAAVAQPLRDCSRPTSLNRSAPAAMHIPQPHGGPQRRRPSARPLPSPQRCPRQTDRPNCTRKTNHRSLVFANDEALSRRHPL